MAYRIAAHRTARDVPGTAMVDKAAIFAELTERNALRREAKLPLLDLRDEFEHAVSLALWDEAWEKHADLLGRNPSRSNGRVRALPIDGRSHASRL